MILDFFDYIDLNFFFSTDIETIGSYIAENRMRKDFNHNIEIECEQAVNSAHERFNKPREHGIFIIFEWKGELYMMFKKHKYTWHYYPKDPYYLYNSYSAIWRCCGYPDGVITCFFMYLGVPICVSGFILVYHVKQLCTIIFLGMKNKLKKSPTSVIL